MTEQQFSPLVADVITKMISDGQDVTNRIIEGLTERAELAEAELQAVRTAVINLLSDRYMPTPTILLEALWPKPEVIAEYRERE